MMEEEWNEVWEDFRKKMMSGKSGGEGKGVGSVRGASVGKWGESC